MKQQDKFLLELDALVKKYNANIYSDESICIDVGGETVVDLYDFVFGIAKEDKNLVRWEEIIQSIVKNGG